MGAKKRQIAEISLRSTATESEGRGLGVQLLRKDGSTWVSKYARGGSARKLSARRFYIAVDALQASALTSP